MWWCLRGSRHDVGDVEAFILRRASIAAKVCLRQAAYFTAPRKCRPRLARTSLDSQPSATNCQTENRTNGHI